MMSVWGVPIPYPVHLILEKDGDSPTRAFLSKDTSRFINIMDSFHGPNVPSLEGMVITSI